VPGGLTELLRRPRYEVFPLPGIEDELAAHVPTDVKVTVTSSPRRGLEATLRLTEAAVARGFEAVPHLAARLVRSEAELEELLERLRLSGVGEVFVIAGDAEEPAGPYAGAADLLAAMAALSDSPGHSLEAGIAGYPESHPFIADQTTIQAMFDKAPFASYIVSQLCLDPAVIASWIDAVRARGVELPIHVGIPGVTPRRKLLRIATRIGVGESLRFARSQGNVLTRVFLGGRVGPGRLFDGLAGQAARIAGLHVYTFNELAETERWRRGMLEQLAA
jgi:methylenetetrahydrofolate reductase (NADPH)